MHNLQLLTSQQQWKRFHYEIQQVHRICHHLKLKQNIEYEVRTYLCTYVSKHNYV